MYLLIILTALLPVAVLAFYIYRKDRLSPEPTSQLVKAFLFGVLSAPLSTSTGDRDIYTIFLTFGSQNLLDA